MKTIMYPSKPLPSEPVEVAAMAWRLGLRGGYESRSRRQVFCDAGPSRHQSGQPRTDRAQDGSTFVQQRVDLALRGQHAIHR
jgi:hypothetical protein